MVAITIRDNTGITPSTIKFYVHKQGGFLLGCNLQEDRMNIAESTSKLIYSIESIRAIERIIQDLVESQRIYYCYGTSDSLKHLASSLDASKKELISLLNNELAAQAQERGLK